MIGLKTSEHDGFYDTGTTSGTGLLLSTGVRARDVLIASRATPSTHSPSKVESLGGEEREPRLVFLLLSAACGEA